MFEPAAPFLTVLIIYSCPRIKLKESEAYEPQSNHARGPRSVTYDSCY